MRPILQIGSPTTRATFFPANLVSQAIKFPNPGALISPAESQAGEPFRFLLLRDCAGLSRAIHGIGQNKLRLFENTSGARFVSGF